MSFLDQMKLPGLIDLYLILILASKGQSWKVNLTSNITTTRDSNVTIQCTFSVPKEHQTENVQIYWKKPGRSQFSISDNDKNAFVFHPNDTFVLKKYRKRTKLIGNKAKGNCSLEILNIRDNEPNIYLRVIAKGDQYSFKKHPVSIHVSGVPPVIHELDVITEPIPTYETMNFSTVGATHTSTTMYVAIFVPVAALLIIVVVGIVLYKKHERSQTCTRQESGYYANFSRAPLNQATREASSKELENKKLPDLQVIDEPVYVNTVGSPGRMDHTENIYANVDHSGS